METQRKERILVVDDEASIRRILEARLSMIGYDVVTASDGEEALKVRYSHYYVDRTWGCCRSDTGLELGADDYAVKPFSLKELEARIRFVLRKS